MKKLAVVLLLGTTLPCFGQTPDPGPAAVSLDLRPFTTHRGIVGWLRVSASTSLAGAASWARPVFGAATLGFEGPGTVRAPVPATFWDPAGAWIPGPGLGARLERIEWAGTSALAMRPWVRTSAGIALSRSAPRPFLGVEFALPLAPGEEGGAPGSRGPAESAAPPYQIGIYGGFRF